MFANVHFSWHSTFYYCPYRNRKWTCIMSAKQKCNRTYLPWILLLWVNTHNFSKISLVCFCHACLLSLLRLSCHFHRRVCCCFSYFINNNNRFWMEKLQAVLNVDCTSRFSICHDFIRSTWHCLAIICVLTGPSILNLKALNRETQLRISLTRKVENFKRSLKVLKKKDRLCIVWSATNRSDWNLYLPVYLWIGTVVNLKIGFFFHIALHCTDQNIRELSHVA